jgi:hypothetical protein
LVGVAVKVTEVPAQIVLAEAAMLTLTGRFGLTVMVMAFEVAGFPVGQVALEVSTQVTTLPLASAALVYVLLFVPTAVAPTYH